MARTYPQRLRRIESERGTGFVKRRSLFFLSIRRLKQDTILRPFRITGDTSGTIYIRVLDTNRDNKAKGLDTIYVDHMFTRSQ